MDGFTLRCNNLRCRAQLDVRAAVTTCRHVYLNTIHIVLPTDTEPLFSVIFFAYPVHHPSNSPSHHSTASECAPHVRQPFLSPTMQSLQR